MTLSRRRFIAGTAAALGGALALDGFRFEPRRLEVTRYDLPIPGLPADLEGLRIAQVTDVHLHGGIHVPARISLESLAEERPDLVLMTGDIIESVDLLDDLTSYAREAQGRLATIATLGNWEHWAHISPGMAESAYHRAGAELLINANRTVRVGNASITIIGLDDPRAGFPSLPTALQGATLGDVNIIMVHAPGYVDQLKRESTPPTHLILSGHTHGGQIRIPPLPALTPKASGRFVAGWYRDTVGPLYVSRGIGTSAVRARLFCPPELPILTLKRDSGVGIPDPGSVES